MKELKMIAAVGGLLLIGSLSVKAQSTDTIPREKKTQEKSQESSNMREMSKITPTEVPASLRQTLQNPEYKGWDGPNSTIHKNKAGDRYTVEIRNESGVKRVYRFDSDGKLIRE